MLMDAGRSEENVREADGSRCPGREYSCLAQKNMPQNACVNSALRHFFIGVTRFELATSASLRRRSSQTKPHPVEQNLL